MTPSRDTIRKPHSENGEILCGFRDCKSSANIYHEELVFDRTVLLNHKSYNTHKFCRLRVLSERILKLIFKITTKFNFLNKLYNTTVAR